MKQSFILAILFVLLSGCTLTSRARNAEPLAQDRVEEATAAATGPRLELGAQGTILNLEQTVGNATMRLQWVYADADLIHIGYSISGSDGYHYEPFVATLTTAAGVLLPTKAQYAVIGQNDAIELEPRPESGAFVHDFDMVDLPSLPLTLDLHLVVELAESSVPPGAPLPARFTLQPASNAGPFTFDFTSHIQR